MLCVASGGMFWAPALGAIIFILLGPSQVCAGARHHPRGETQNTLAKSEAASRQACSSELSPTPPILLGPSQVCARLVITQGVELRTRKGAVSEQGMRLGAGGKLPYSNVVGAPAMVPGDRAEGNHMSVSIHTPKYPLT